jgi:hypothetical protein
MAQEQFLKVLSQSRDSEELQDRLVENISFILSQCEHLEDPLKRTGIQACCLDMLTALSE